MPRRTATRLTTTIIEQAARGSICFDSETPGFGLRVTPAGTKSFVFQFRPRDGGQGRMVIGGYPSMTLDKARKIARAHRVAVDEGKNPSLDRKVQRDAATVRDLADHYCDEYGPLRGLKDRTIKDARHLLQKYALPKYGTRKVDAITSGDVIAMHNAANKGSGRYQANRLLAVLSKMFSLARRNGWTTKQPCIGIEKFPEDQRSRYLSEAHVGALLRSCDQHQDQHAADAVRLLLFTGARLREVLRADWTQFDLSEGLWVKPSAHTKTKRVHRLHLAPDVLKLLKEMRMRDPSSHFLFPGRDGTKPRVDLKRPWDQIVERAGIGKYTPHDLRRTTASFMLSTGADISAVGKSLGHTQAATTNRYAQLFNTVQLAASTRATELMLRAHAGDSKPYIESRP